MNTPFRYAAALLIIGTASGCDPEQSPDPTVPAAPTSVTVVAGAAQATVSWSAPSDDGGSAITGYTVTSSPGGLTAETSGATTAVVTGLTNGIGYTFTVVARNAVGTSPSSTPSNEVTPTSAQTVPGPPTDVVASAGDGVANVEWSAPSSDGGSAITGYTVTSSPDGLTASTASATSAEVSGLTNGVSYTFTVTAENAEGTGTASAPSNAVTPTAAPTVPGMPTDVVASAGDSIADVEWSAPSSDGGSAITGYTVTSSPGGLTASTVGATSAEVSGLTNGVSYTFTVTAENAEGTGLASASSNAVTPATVPGVPTDVTATAGDAQATVEWNAPSSNGGSAITGYTVTSNPEGLTASTTGATSAVVGGLTNGVAYTFTVTATNARGTGPSSASSAAVVPVAAPGAPTDVTAVAGDAQATVDWMAPADDGGSAITGYTVTSSPGGLTAATAGATSAVVSGLTNGVAYTFTVTASNADGTGPASDPSNEVTPAAAPGAPTAVTAVPGDSEASVSWTAPSDDGGAAIAGYTVTSDPEGLTASTAGATSAVVSGLTNGVAYTFTVTATNAAGTGPASEPSEAVTAATVPGAPTDVAAAAGDAQATVGWTAPVDDGGSAITGYVVTSSPGGLTAFSAGATYAMVNGLTNGVAYTFTVTASNAAGTGPASAASNEVTPAGAPGAPTAVTATADDAEATVSWTAPSNDGGSAITGYTVTSNPGWVTEFTDGATSAVVSGLDNGVAYTFTVRATNAMGTGSASEPSNEVVPEGAPTAPRNVGAVSAESLIAVEWDPPSNDGGSPIATYSLISTPAGIALDTAATRVEVAEGTGTSYTFAVTATNSIGTSPASAPSNAVTTRAGGCLGTPVMGAPQIFTGGTSLTWIAHGDLNGDGLMDLVTPGETIGGTRSIGVLLGRGEGLFSPAVPYFAGTSPRGVTIGDFDADGALDLAVADSDGDSVGLLLGVGDGTFGSAQDTATDTGPGPIVSADFNADGRLDLATGNQAGTLSVLLGAGGGSFLPPVTYPVSAYPLSANDSLAVADFDADGHPDLVVGDTFEMSVDVLLGNGDGTFAAPVVTSIGKRPYGLTVGDFDADGDLDVATANALTDELTVLLGLGDGGFGPAVSYPSGGTQPFSTIADDFDGDGLLDLVATNTVSNTSSFLKGAGDGTFAAAATLDAGLSPVTLTHADFDGDGALDLAVLNTESLAPSVVTLLMGTGTGTFSTAANYSVGTPAGVSTADFDGDGHLDLAVASDDDTLRTLLGNGDGSFQAPVQLGAGGRPRTTATSDFDGDGNADVVVVNQSPGTLGIFLGDGSGGFAAQVEYPVGTVNEVVIGDFDGDGAQDLASAGPCSFCTAGHFVKVLLGVGDGTFGAATEYMTLPGGYGETTSVRTADLDGDGALDLVTVNGRVDNISVLLGAGDGTFLDAVTYPAGDRPHSLAIADLDGDGIQDVATANRNSDDISVLLGVGDGTFGPATHHGPAGQNPSGIVAVDLNDDGAVDLVTANLDSGSVTLFQGRGNGSFDSSIRGLATLGVRSVATGDFDGDGDLDLVSAGYGFGKAGVDVFLARACVAP